jgi:hypothetical protein
LLHEGNDLIFHSLIQRKIFSGFFQSTPNRLLHQNYIWSIKYGIEKRAAQKMIKIQDLREKRHSTINKAKRCFQDRKHEELQIAQAAFEEPQKKILTRCHQFGVTSSSSSTLPLSIA